MLLAGYGVSTHFVLRHILTPYTNIISVLMYVCMKSVAKQPQNLCIISVIYGFVHVPQFLKVVLIFLWNTYDL